MHEIDHFRLRKLPNKKSQNTITLTILYGDQTGNNDDEIRAESLKLDLRFTPENTRPQTCQFLQRSVCPLAEEDL